MMTIPSCMSAANRIPDSRDGERAAVGCEQARVYAHPKRACSAGREDAIVCGV